MLERRDREGNVFFQYSNTSILQYSNYVSRFTFHVLDMKFEEALKSLEKSVEQLESGDLPLEKALEVFENGIKMSRVCSKKLEEAEQKVELLLGVSDDGEAQTTLFDTDMLEE